MWRDAATFAKLRLGRSIRRDRFRGRSLVKIGSGCLDDRFAVGSGHGGGGDEVP
ncbi:hypothetical protein HJC99_06360 [Candidatus Saccharibacteria bacterium]|nr:hypothetical protein [Candidatus Saccharibacteria bacterium]